MANPFGGEKRPEDGEIAGSAVRVQNPAILGLLNTPIRSSPISITLCLLSRTRNERDSTAPPFAGRDSWRRAEREKRSALNARQGFEGARAAAASAGSVTAGS